MSKRVNEILRQNKNVLLMHAVSFGILFLGFVLCRFVFFGLHGMKEWPLDLLVVGLVVLLVSMLARRKYVPWFSSIGYFVGFLAGVIFHTKGFDPGGGRTDNLWQIWTIIFVVCILAGIVFEFVMKWWRLLKKH
jgi:MFS family permease